MLFSLLLAGLVPVELSASEDFVTFNSITIRTTKLTDRQIRIAQRYATCVSMPYFPLERERKAKLAKCRTSILRRPTSALKETLDHIDDIITENSGSEAELSVKRDISSKK